MKNSIQKNKRHHLGFTLIEMIVVIGLVGALAVGLIAAIDPVEQFRRGRDTAIRNAASNFFQAEQRYYAGAGNGAFTWGTTGFTASVVNGRTADLTSLINGGELKTNFVQQTGTTNLSLIYATSTSSDDVGVCFLPTSKEFQKDPVTIYGSSGVTAASCKSGGGTADCYMCFR